MKGLAMFKLQACVFSAACYLTACGHSQQEWDQQLRENQVLKQQLQLQQSAASTCGESRQTVQSQLEQVVQTLQTYGLSPQTLPTDLERLRVAGEEYRTRLEQINEIARSFGELRQQLERSGNSPLRVTVRNNRVTIQVPAPALFTSTNGSALSESGRSLLLRVADAIRTDEKLARRHFEVAGHLPAPAGDAAQNGWSLSTENANAVVSFLTRAKGQGGGGLSPGQLSAAGYAGQDPVASNESEEGQQRNRRIEIVLRPRAEETLNLEQLEGSSAG